MLGNPFARQHDRWCQLRGEHEAAPPASDAVEFRTLLEVSSSGFSVSKRHIDAVQRGQHELRRLARRKHFVAPAASKFGSNILRSAKTRLNDDPIAHFQPNTISVAAESAGTSLLLYEHTKPSGLAPPTGRFDRLAEQRVLVQPSPRRLRLGLDVPPSPFLHCAIPPLHPVFIARFMSDKIDVAVPVIHGNNRSEVHSRPL